MKSKHPPNKNRKLLILSVLCFSLILIACSKIPGGITPAEAVKKTFSSPDDQVAGVRNIDQGAVVLHHKVQPDFIPGDPGTPSYQLGFAYSDQRNGRWWVRSGRSGSFTPEKDAKIIFQITRLQTGDQNPGNEGSDDPTVPLILFGKALDERIVKVKLLTQDKQEIQDILTDSMFAIISKPEVIPCTLQALDAQENLVEQIDLVHLPEWQVSPDLGLVIDQSCSDKP